MGALPPPARAFWRRLTGGGQSSRPVRCSAGGLSGVVPTPSLALRLQVPAGGWSFGSPSSPNTLLSSAARPGPRMPVHPVHRRGSCLEPRPRRPQNAPHLPGLRLYRCSRPTYSTYTARRPSRPEKRVRRARRACVRKREEACMSVCMWIARAESTHLLRASRVDM